jgi:hypothetical protein
LHPVTTGLLLSSLHCQCDRARFEARADGVRIATAGRRAKTLRLNARGRRQLAARHRLVVTVSSHEFVSYLGRYSSEFRTVITLPRP